ncbi:hypothetical protein [Alicyclobacillus contaminans]|uniref:hypothetical protein n=1 Tax=Alicyclobacillus contaminans TaxID=392016 RepID=UPI0004054F39|nr:hypothetical protein [Alicyclobacillus contaminans]
MATWQRVTDIPIAKQLYNEVADGRSADKAQLFFTASVLNKYRESGSYKIIRTDTSGRLSHPGVWSVDFGISGEDDTLVHIPVTALVHKIPETEREHWLSHMITLPVSENFLKGLIRPGCLDDGDIRAW